MEIKKINFGNILSYIVLALVVSPILYIFIKAFNPNTELTKHIFKYLLKEYMINTFLILIPTVFFTFIIGVSLAYFETFYEYKLRNFFKYINVLCFALPSYLLSYIYVDLLDGIVYNLTGIYVDIANIKGAIFILSIAFFPYVYICSRSSMKKISMDIIYTSKMLGSGSIKTFFKIILPMSRLSIISGLMLVVMETLNSFAVPYFFGIRVFSTGIYDAWINYYDLDGAVKISAILICIVIFILFIEQLSKKNIVYDTREIVKIKRVKLSLFRESLVILYMFIISLFSFFIPLYAIFRWLILSIKYNKYSDIFIYTKTTIYVLIVSVLVIIIVALFLTNINRFKKNKSKYIINKIANIGYSIPGSVIAIGFLSIFISLDLFLIKKGITDSMLLIKSPLIIVLAYMTRFLSVAYIPLESSIEKTGNNIHYSSRILGMSHIKTFFKIDIYQQKLAIISAFLLLSVEIIKEMPLAAMLLNQSTLAVKMKNYASDEELVLIAFPAIILVLIAGILIYIYNSMDTKDDK